MVVVGGWFVVAVCRWVVQLVVFFLMLDRIIICLVDSFLEGCSCWMIMGVVIGSNLRYWRLGLVDGSVGFSWS